MTLRATCAATAVGSLVSVCLSTCSSPKLKYSLVSAFDKGSKVSQPQLATGEILYGLPRRELVIS